MDLDIKNTKFSSPGRLSAVIEVNCIMLFLRKFQPFCKKLRTRP